MQVAEQSQLTNMAIPMASGSAIFENEQTGPQLITLIEFDPTAIQDTPSSSSQHQKKQRTQDSNTDSSDAQDDQRASSKIDAPTAMQLARFEVNWLAIPAEIISQLDCPEENCGYFGLTESGYNRLVEHIVVQMRAISTRIPFANFRQVASKVAAKYKVLLDVDDEGHVYGDGSAGLAEKLKNHNSYLNRSFKPGKIKQKEMLGRHLNRQCRVGVKEVYYRSDNRMSARKVCRI